MSMSWCGRMASTIRSVGTVPLVPGSGERKIATSAAAPAFSTRSPMRTTLLVTVTLARSAGTAFCAAADAGSSADEREQERENPDAEADHGQDLSHFISCDVVCSISSAAVMTLEFIS